MPAKGTEGKSGASARSEASPELNIDGWLNR